MSPSQTRALRRRLAPWMKAAALGAVVGSRSMLVPALISRHTPRRGASRVWTLLAAMELVADKTPWVPSRTAPPSLVGRSLIGSAVAFGTTSSSRRWPSRSAAGGPIGAAIVGGSFAVASAFLVRALRVRVGARSRAAAVLGGLLEDMVAIAAGRALTRA